MTNPARRGSSWSFAPWAALVLAVLVVHARDVSFGLTSLDDQSLIVDDQAFLRGAGAWWRAFGRAYFEVTGGAQPYWRPLVTASYAIDARLSGTSPALYHATNVALHAAATLLAFTLLVRTGATRAASLAGALVLAVHPAVVAAVAWIPGRNDTMLAVFVLGALHLYERGRVGAWIGHFACFAAALLVKETAVVMPALASAWSVIVLRRAPRAMVAITWGVSLAFYLLARHSVLAASGPRAVVDVSTVFRNAVAIPEGLGKLLFAAGLAPLATRDEGSSALAALAVVVAMGLAVALRSSRVALFGLVLIIVPLLPTAFVGGALTLENRLYLPVVGLGFVVGAAFDRIAAEMRVKVAFASAVAFGLALLSMGHAEAFRDPLRFGKAAVDGAPHSALAHFTLGRARQARGDLDAALSEYATALTLAPDTPMVHNNVAVVWMRRAEWARAERALLEELRINPGDPIATENLAKVRAHLR